jgi:hypothetical protein
VEVVNGNMKPVLKIVVQLVDLHSGFVFEGLLILVDGGQLSLVVLEDV